MKLLFVIINNDTAGTIINQLNSEGFSVTKLCSTGGFLRSGNTTLIMGIENEKVDSVIRIIKEKCKDKDQVLKSPNSASHPTAVSSSNTAKFKVGCATIFVTDINHFEKA